MLHPRITAHTSIGGFVGAGNEVKLAMQIVSEVWRMLMIMYMSVPLG